jgi:hypothetical protein
MKRFFTSCGKGIQKLMPKTTMEITEDAVHELQLSTEKTKEEADELELDIHADARRLRQLKHSGAPKSQQIELMRSIQYNKERLDRLRNMQHSNARAVHDSKDVLLVAQNAKAQKGAMHAQRSALKSDHLSVDSIDKMLEEVESGKDIVVEAAMALGSGGKATTGSINELDVDRFLMDEFGNDGDDVLSNLPNLPANMDICEQGQHKDGGGDVRPRPQFVV